MALSGKTPPKRHEPLVGRAEDFRWYWQTEWSCPLHERDENGYFDDEEADIVCLGCLAAGWKKVYDEDGWATLIFEERDAMAKIMEHYYLPVVLESLNTNKTLIIHNITGE